MNRPDIAQCRTTLRDGRVATVTATRRPRQGRADVKCSCADAALVQRVQQLVRLARHTEARMDSRDQVVISIDPAPAANERDWELAVVLADRLVRGVWESAPPAHAQGWSGKWELGRVEGCDRPATGAINGGASGLAHLGALTGQPDCGASVASASAWFPLHSGGASDSLCQVEVSVYPLIEPGGEEEEAISAPGLDSSALQLVRRALAGARHFDGRGLGRWRTIVRFSQARFQGNSFELALVMADRLARGREFVPRGRVLASGSSSAWHAGSVEPVADCLPKCALIVREAVAGDRILLPMAWEKLVAPGWQGDLEARGASVAWIDRIGII